MIGPVGRIVVVPEQLDAARAVSARAVAMVADARGAQTAAAATARGCAPELAQALSSLQEAWTRRLDLLSSADEGLAHALGNAAVQYPATDRAQLAAVWTETS